LALPDAAIKVASADSPVSALNVVGHDAPRIDAVERVSGRAKYTADVMLPNMLYARVLRSPHPHARIRRIDASKARALPGVKAIVTHENCTTVWGAGSISGGAQYNDEIKKITKHRRYAFNNPVRFVGEPVAAVAAVNRHVAEEALRLIAVDYEPLPFVLDPEEALKPDAVKIWPEGNLSPTARNEFQPIGQKRGSVDDGFKASDRVFEERFSTSFVHNAQMEPRSAVAHWEGDKLTIYTPTGGIANCRTDMARDLGIAPENVRVVCLYMGGNFGNKNQNQDADLIAAALAKEAGAPVKLELSRKEDYVGMHGRWPTVQYYKVGVKADGTLQAIQLRGFSGMGPYRKNSGNIAGVEIYQCPNIETSISPVYTNRTVSGNFRGPEYPQGFFGIQSMMDDVAAKMKMDPVEFILRNMTRKAGDQTPYTNYSLEECIRRGADAFEWKTRWKSTPGSDPGPIKRGAGVSFMAFRAGLGRSSAVVRATATPNPTLQGKVRSTFGAHFVEVEVDVDLGRARVVKYLAVHDCGRIINPLTARSQIRGGATMGIGMALHEDLLYDRRSGTPLTPGYYGARVATHRDAPEIDVIFIESDDGLGPFGAKSMGESSKVPSPAAVANAVANATGHRMKDLPITREKLVAALAAEKGGRS